MKMKFENVRPEEIEKRSFEIITEELNGKELPMPYAPIIKRVIHTTADFDYADTLTFSTDVLTKAFKAIKNGACIVTDTQMVKSGINKTALNRFGGEVYNFIADKDVAEAAIQNNTTRSSASIDKALKLNKPLIFAVGNAPTALIRLHELISNNLIRPELIIGVPVGFVNVVQAKELILSTDIPHIITKGRKGGSNVCAAIINALLYMLASAENK